VPLPPTKNDRPLLRHVPQFAGVGDVTRPQVPTEYTIIELVVFPELLHAIKAFRPYPAAIPVQVPVVVGVALKFQVLPPSELIKTELALDEEHNAANRFEPWLYAKYCHTFAQESRHTQKLKKKERKVTSSELTR
jgi:hypothetical protein